MTADRTCLWHRRSLLPRHGLLTPSTPRVDSRSHILFARLPATPAAPALQAPTPARDEPATATRRVLLHPAIIPLLSPPLALPDQAIRKRYGHLNVHDAITPLLSPPLACPCLEASKGASYPGLRYYSPWYHSWVGVPSEPNLTHCTALTPPPILEEAQ